MRHLRQALLLVLLLAAGCSRSAPEARPPRGPVPPLVVSGIRRVVLIVLENGNPATAAAQPFMRRRAREGTVLERYYALAHPSQPNYIALISGSTAGAPDNRKLSLRRPHIGNALGSRWRVYADGYPALRGRCNLVAESGLYVRRHVPFLSFADVQRGECAQIVRLDAPGDPVAALRADIAGGTLPDFALIVPNLLHDGHEPATLRDADQWLTASIEPLLADAAFTAGTLFVLTFDEDDSDGPGNRVFTVLWGDHVQPGRTSRDVYDHQDMLATIAAGLGVPPPPIDDADVRPIGGIWR